MIGLFYGGVGGGVQATAPYRDSLRVSTLHERRLLEWVDENYFPADAGEIVSNNCSLRYTMELMS